MKSDMRDGDHRSANMGSLLESLCREMDIRHDPSRVHPAPPRRHTVCNGEFHDFAGAFACRLTMVFPWNPYRALGTSSPTVDTVCSCPTRSACGRCQSLCCQSRILFLFARRSTTSWRSASIRSWTGIELCSRRGISMTSMSEAFALPVFRSTLFQRGRRFARENNSGRCVLYLGV